MKDKGGRPTVMNEDTLEKLKEAFLMGCTDDEACLFAEIDPQTLYNYQKENPTYSSKKAMWKQNPLLKARKTINEKLNKDENARWYLERKAKGEFSQRNEISGADGEPFVVNLISYTKQDDSKPKDNST